MTQKVWKYSPDKLTLPDHLMPIVLAIRKAVPRPTIFPIYDEVDDKIRWLVKTGTREIVKVGRHRSYIEYLESGDCKPACPMGLHPNSVSLEPYGSRTFIELDVDPDEQSELISEFADWWDDIRMSQLNTAMSIIWPAKHKKKNATTAS